MAQKTRALRLYGADDLRLEEFALPDLKDDEILVRVISDSICMSTYKLLKQGKNHQRCPQNVDTNPVITGHEFAGDIAAVGKKWRQDFRPGEQFALQPALNYRGSLAAPGYSYEFCGGDTAYCIIPPEVMEQGCLLHYRGDAYFYASLAEPLSCIIGGYHAMYHTRKEDHAHIPGIREGGNVLILGGAGPMGLGAIEYALAGPVRPGRVAVLDADERRLRRAEKLIPPETARRHGVELVYVNPRDHADQDGALMDISGGRGYDDVFVYAPIRDLAELGDRLLAPDGGLNFFAGPQEKDFSARINLYNCHYGGAHILGSTGGNTDDLEEALLLSARGKLRPALMVSHICGLDSMAEATACLPELRAGKILGYTQINLPLTALADFEKLGRENPLFAELAKLCGAHQGLWNAGAERCLLRHFGVENGLNPDVSSTGSAGGA